ncbi:MAG TPA: hypothetical protein PK760_00900, partial [Flavobacteriales bacterium]|nr:hypothetical protein [Flavobacteriales bacterium]
MKKFPSLISYAFAMCSVTSEAQDTARVEWSAMMAANYTWMRDPLSMDNGRYTGRGADGMGGTMALQVEAPLRKSFSIVAEPGFVLRTSGYAFIEGQRGSTTDPLADGVDQGRKSTHTYSAQLPMVLAYRGVSGLRLEAGAYTAY